jgi:ribosomal protein S18 acetylase RimI-like enzyme
MPPETIPITTRPATAADLPEVHRMLIALAAHHGDQATIRPAQLARLALHDPAVTVLVAHLRASPSPHPVGYALIQRLPNPVTGGSRGDIAHLFVQADLRGRGIGRALISAARELARHEGIERLSIGTPPANAAAVAVYRAMGLAELPIPGPRFAVIAG